MSTPTIIAGFRAETNAHFAEVKKKLKELGVVQDQHTTQLQRHYRMLDDLLLFAVRTKEDLKEFRVEVADFKTEVTSEIGTLKGDVSTLKGDVAELKGDMVEVKGALAEILDRLPAKGA